MRGALDKPEKPRISIAVKVRQILFFVTVAPQYQESSSHTFIGMKNLGFGLGLLQPENKLIKSF
jgi:hypothetical protein